MDLAFWRDVSIVFLSIQTFILLIIPLVAFYFAVRGLNFLHIRLPRVMYKAQDISKQVKTQTEAASQRVVDPIISADRERAKTAAAMRSLVTGSATPAGSASVGSSASEQASGER